MSEETWRTGVVSDYTLLHDRATDALRHALASNVHPSWFKPLSLKRRNTEMCDESTKMIASAMFGSLHDIGLLLCEDNRPQLICGLSGNFGRYREPLACAYPKGHDGPHAWDSLPTFVTGSPAEPLEGEK